MALCFVETDSVGRVRTLRLSQDGRYRFERDDGPAEDPLCRRRAPQGRPGGHAALGGDGGLVRTAEEITADQGRFPEFEKAARERLASLLAAEEDWERALPGLFGELFLASAGREREKGSPCTRGSAAIGRWPGPPRENTGSSWSTPLTLAQRLGELYGRNFA